MSGPVVIVGTGQAGLQVALSLRAEAYPGDVTLVGDEPGLPYGRPPLSKAYLLGKVEEAGLHLRPAEALVAQRIRLAAPERAVAIDRAARSLRLASGEALPYQHLVLAMGTRNRRLSVPGADLDGVVYLRSLGDAKALRERLASARTAAVIGAGFIGLEFAAVASTMGVKVHVLEVAGRAMARAVSPAISAYFARRHTERGATLTFGAAVASIEGEAGRVTGLRLADGAGIPADLVLVGIGVLPNAELAAEAGLAVDNGIVVDDHLATADPAISAIGDCAAHPSVHAEAMTRLESVQNAIDQAKAVAARLCGRPAPYRSVPWFWSDQGADKLQIAGLAASADDAIVKGDEAEGRFAVFRFRGERLTAVETVNRAGDHMAARRAIVAPRPPTLAEVGADGFDLRAWLAASA